MKLFLIAAVAENDVIGAGNQLPWRLPADTTYFQSLTGQKPILMGRKTAESPDVFFSRTRNVIISRSTQPPRSQPPAEWYPDLPTALRHLEPEPEVFVCGGAEIYRQTMPLAQRLYITRVHHRFEGDAFFPTLNESEWHILSRDARPADAENPYPFTFMVYERREK